MLQPPAPSPQRAKTFATRLLLAGVFLLAAHPLALHGQGPCYPGGNSLPVSISGPICFEVQVPQDRKFVVLTIAETFGYWKDGFACTRWKDLRCAPLDLRLKLTGPGGWAFEEPLSGNGLSHPTGPGWVPDPPTPPHCFYCGQVCLLNLWQSEAKCGKDFCGLDCDNAQYTACMQKAGGTYSSCLASVPTNGYDTWLSFTRTFVKAVSLPPGMTKNGSVTLTLRGSSTGNGSAVSMSAQLYSDTRFILTQTPDSFRPRDARDAAAECAAHDGDCYPRFKMQLATGPVAAANLALQGRWPTRGEWAGARPQPAASRRTPPSGDWFDGPSQEGGGRPQATLIQATPMRAAFSPAGAQMFAGKPLSAASASLWRSKPRPRMRLNSLGAAMALGSPPPPAPAATFHFTLSQPSASSGKWLKGASTNHGADTEANPDYLFEKEKNLAPLGPPSSGGLSIGTSEEVTEAVYVFVTSHDFGGVAQLRATGTIGTFNPLTFDAEVLDQNAKPVKPPENNVVLGGRCGSDFARRAYASLPVDQDCNGMADGWEKSIRVSGNLCPYCDDEPGPLGTGTASAYKGDGFSVFDEYRGFHVTGANGRAVWASTDPTKQDLFYWDASNFIVDGNPRLGNHLENVFGKETRRFVALHRLTGGLAHANDEGDPRNPKKGVGPLNFNSPFAGPRGFAVVFMIENLNKPTVTGKLGIAGFDDDLVNSFRNTGKSPIRIDLDQIQKVAKDLWSGDSTNYASTLLDQVLAHETGHKLGREHRERTAAKVPFETSGIKSLSIGQFMQDPKNVGKPKAAHTTLFVEESVYQTTIPAGFKANGKYIQESVTGASQRTGARMVSLPWMSFSQSEYGGGGSAKPPQWPFQIAMDSTQAIDQITIDSQDGTIMCYTPRLDQIHDSDWMFAPDDLGSLCLTTGGCGICQKGVCK